MMTETYFTTTMPQSNGIVPKVADLWVEKINEDDRVWWRWTGKTWKHAGDNLTSHNDDQGNPEP